MRGRRVGVAVVVGLLLLAGGVAVVSLAGAKACSKIGCGSQATFDVASLDAAVRDRASSYTLCLDGRCERTASRDPDAVAGVWGRLDGTTVESGSLVVVDAAGAEVARYDLDGPTEVDRWYPNGEGCEPMCPQLPLVVAGGVLRKATQ